MDTAQILALLTAERDRLNNAIGALRGTAQRRTENGGDSAPAQEPNATPKKSTRRGFTPAQRKQQAERMRAFWAAKRKAAAAHPGSVAGRKKSKA